MERGLMRLGFLFFPLISLFLLLSFGQERTPVADAVLGERSCDHARAREIHSKGEKENEKLPEERRSKERDFVFIS